jgi:hypothetical protein
MCLVRFLGHKKCKTYRGLNTTSEGSMLSFPLPTRTHIFDNHNNGNGCLSTSHVRSSVGH